jgi:DNA recombination protein RmuC
VIDATTILLIVLTLLVAGVLVFLIVLAKRWREGGGENERQLQAQVAALTAQSQTLAAQAAERQGQADERQTQITGLQNRRRELEEQLNDEIGGRRAAEASLAAERKNLLEQKALLDEAQAKLQNAFKALSADALKSSNEQFLSQADERLKPIRDLLGAYEVHLREIEKVRSDAYGGLKNQLDTLARVHDVLQKETHQLATALRSPTVRGRWGEVTLKRVVEVAGMSAYCDFETQVSVTGEDGLQRPDMIVKLPNERIIVVDSKVPLEAFLEAMDGDEPTRRAALARHALAVKSRINGLGQQSYARQFKSVPEFVVLFLPGESFFSAALEQDRDLIEYGMSKGVILATPTTLIALLKAVAYGWQQQTVTENARRIADAGRELYERLCTFAGHLGKVGKGIQDATKAYNAAVGSYETRLEPSARKLTELGAASEKELPDIARAEEPLRTLPALAAPPDKLEPAKLPEGAAPAE